MTGALSVETHDLDGMMRLRDAWQDLAGRCLEPNAFAEPGFLLAAARHLARGKPPAFITVRAHPAGAPARLIAVCPIVRPRLPGPWPARVWTHPQATAAVPLLDSAHGAAALSALLQAVGQGRGGTGALLLGGLDVGGATAAALRQTGRPVAWLDPRSRAVLVRGGQAPGLRGGARKELRRQGNRLAEQGALTFSSARTPEEIAAALRRFLDLENEGWKGRRGTALGSTPDTRAFAEAALAALADAGQGRIDGLWLDDRPLAMGIVLRSRDRAFFWKTAYDEGFARFSPGLQLASRITEAQLADTAVALTDSCAVPGHSMIDRLWPDRAEVADGLVATRDFAPAAFARTCAAERSRRAIRMLAKRAIRSLGRR